MGLEFGDDRFFNFWPLPHKPMAVVSFVLTDFPIRLSINFHSLLKMFSLSRLYTLSHDKVLGICPTFAQPWLHLKTRFIRTLFVLRMKYPFPISSHALRSFRYMHEAPSLATIKEILEDLAMMFLRLDSQRLSSSTKCCFLIMRERFLSKITENNFLYTIRAFTFYFLFTFIVLDC